MLLDSTLQTMEKPLKPQSMRGERALLTAVIYQAVIDYQRGDVSARRYFEGDTYRDHLAWLDLPVNWLPEGVNV